MNTIIIINGTSSSGKSTIARAVADMLDEPFLCFGIDAFIDMLPEKYRSQGYASNDGFYYEQAYQGNVPIVASHCGVVGKTMLELIPQVIALMSKQQLNIIVDEVILDDHRFLKYVSLLHDFRVYSIGITCDVVVLENRALLRGNRPLGLARWQIPLIHEGIRFYDLMIDTTYSTIQESAQLIVTYMNNNIVPKAFLNAYNKYYCDTL